MMFTIFDIIILTILFASSIMGLYRGVVYITVNFLGFIASIFAAIFLYSYVYIIFSKYIANDLVSSIGSGIISYIVSLIVFTFLSSKIVLLFKENSQGVFDRLIGFIIGLARGGIISLLIFSIVAVFSTGTYSGAEKAEDIVNNLSIDKYPEWLKDSITTEYLEKTLKNSIVYIPKNVLDSIKIPKEDKETNQIDKIKKKKSEKMDPISKRPIDKSFKNSIDKIIQGS